MANTCSQEYIKIVSKAHFPPSSPLLIWPPPSNEFDAHPLLSILSRVKNIWAKVTLGRVKNNGDFQQNRHPHFSAFSYAMYLLAEDTADAVGRSTLCLGIGRTRISMIKPFYLRVEEDDNYSVSQKPSYRITILSLSPSFLIPRIDYMSASQRRKTTNSRLVWVAPKNIP